MKDLKRIFISLLTNPILIIVYGVFCYKLASLCMYEGVKSNIYILSACIVFFIAITIFTVVRIKKFPPKEYEGGTALKIWRVIAIIILVVITLFYGVKIYKSAVNYNGKLAWFIESLKSERSVKFTQNNIYTYGVEGIFKDINKKYTLPEKLYITNSFNLKFDPDGTITAINTFIYGKNAKGKEESYLINYDKSKSDNIGLTINGHANSDYNDDKLLEPLIETVKVIPIKNTISKWNENKYGLLYYGKREWGGNREGLINIDEKGNEVYIGSNNLIGYTVSLFVPEKENQITPFRYNLINNSSWSRSNTPPKNSSLDGGNNSKSKDEFYLSEDIGYKLEVVDKAAGSSLYVLNKTVDGGKSFEVINNNPFNGTVGSVSGIIFIDDKLGFIVTKDPSETTGKLYRTDNGGVSFKKIDYHIHTAKGNNNSSLTPFDCPSIPYEEEGVFNMLITQGSDGDYNGNSKGLYQSKDKGETWKYIIEVK